MLRQASADVGADPTVPEGPPPPCGGGGSAPEEEEEEGPGVDMAMMLPAMDPAMTAVARPE